MEVEVYNLYESLVGKPKLSLSEFKELIKKFHQFTMNEVVEKGKEVKLPSNMGSLCVRGNKWKVKYDKNGKPTNLPVDWKSTKAYWKRNEDARKLKKLIYYLNDESDGYIYSLTWNRRGIKTNNAWFYSFKSAVNHRKKLSRLAKTGKSYKNNR